MDTITPHDAPMVVKHHPGCAYTTVDVYTDEFAMKYPEQCLASSIATDILTKTTTPDLSVELAAAVLHKLIQIKYATDEMDRKSPVSGVVYKNYLVNQFGYDHREFRTVDEALCEGMRGGFEFRVDRFFAADDVYPACHWHPLNGVDYCAAR